MNKVKKHEEIFCHADLHHEFHESHELFFHHEFHESHELFFDPNPDPNPNPNPNPDPNPNLKPLKQQKKRLAPKIVRQPRLPLSVDSGPFNLSPFDLSTSSLSPRSPGR